MSNDVLELRIAEGFAWCMGLVCIAVFVATSVVCYNVFTRVLDSVQCPAPVVEAQQ